jgi:hypothetical protein
MEDGGRVPYQPGGVSLAMGKRFIVDLPGAVFRARLTGLLFDTSKNFLLPGGIHGLRVLKRLHDAHPKMKLVITGHSDRKGGEAYNLTLSNERAAAIAAYLKDDVDTWLKQYGNFIAGEKRWATREDQLMLSFLGDESGPFYKGDIDGKRSPETEAAVRAFQEFSNKSRGTSLGADGKAGDKTRRELIAAYMDQPDTTLPKNVVPLTHGCGEHHNAIPTDDGVALQENRRVEIFFFDGEVSPKPRDPCPGPFGCPEYLDWLRRATHTIDLDRGAGTLTVTVIDAAKAPIAGASVRADGPFSSVAQSDKKGEARFEDMPAGDYSVAVSWEGFENKNGAAKLTDGAKAVLTIALASAKTFLELSLADPHGAPLRRERYRITAPDGTVREGKLDEKGFAREEGLLVGKVEVTFLDLDQDAWGPEEKS